MDGASTYLSVGIGVHWGPPGWITTKVVPTWDETYLLTFSRAKGDKKLGVVGGINAEGRPEIH